MKGIVLAAGRGTRLYPCLLYTSGKSLLDTIGAGKGTALAGTSNAGSSVLSPVSQNSQVIVVNTDASNKKAGGCV